MTKPTPEASPEQLTPRTQDLLDLAAFYAGDDWKEQDLLYLSQALMYACFPYKRTDKRSLTRIINGKMTTICITLSAVKEGVPLPFGKDRVLLACALTKARQKQRPAVQLDELEDLLRSFGEDYRNYGGHDYKLFRERWERLKNCAILIERDSINSSSDDGANRFIISAYRFPKRQPGRKATLQLTLSPREPAYAIRFGAEFWNDFLNYCVPMPLPLMQLFADQPKSWDIATLIHWGSFVAIRSAKSQGSGFKKITWQDLLHILGSEDTNSRRLRSTINSVLKQMRTLWPELNAHLQPSGDLLISAPASDKILVQESNKARQIRSLITNSLQRAF